MTNTTAEIARLYKAAFEIFFLNELSLRGFARLTDQARFLINEHDGHLQLIADELSSVLEATVENQALLIEMNSLAEKSGSYRYQSLEQALPQLHALHAKIIKLLDTNNPY